MGSFIHVLKYIRHSAKITEKITWSVRESETSYNPKWGFDFRGVYSSIISPPPKGGKGIKGS